MTHKDCCWNLGQLLGCYLHQDWMLEYPNADSALADAVVGQGVEQVKSAAKELAAHRPPASDEDASRRFSNELCDYHPPRDGLSYSAWLDRVQQILNEAARTGTPT